jgi:hypothetical protein
MAPMSGSLFGQRPHTGVRAVMTGQVGVDKKPFIERVAEIARRTARSGRLPRGRHDV